jgi:hypothetical protein
MIRPGAVAAALLLAMPALAQGVTSPGPERVQVAVYRDPGRTPTMRMNLGFLGGFAFVTETRTVTIPAGRATIRFEGVAAGMLPESAIVTGLPEGVREKNLDADLLSPGSLYARSFGRPVLLRRSEGGRTVEERAIIRSGPQGAAIIQTREGFFAADCTPGVRERLVYESVPEGLAARPTLSVEVDSPAARTATLTLSYLAWGFDWQANYVATMREDGNADLFAWITLANSDVTSFADAETMVIAGNIRNDSRKGPPPEGRPLIARCYFKAVATGSRGTLGGNVDSVTVYDVAAMPDRSVTESLKRVPGVSMNRFARQEDLGDLKLYRVPEPTTIAARGQKQVALLAREKVPVEVIHRIDVNIAEATAPLLLLRAQNREEKGLGLPLPAGQVTLFEPHGGEPMLIGEGAILDKAVNEEVEVDFAAATQVQALLTQTGGAEGARQTRHLLTVTNPRPFPVRFEAEFVAYSGLRYRFDRRVGRKDGRDLWAVTLPANGSAALRYAVTRPKHW